MAEYHSINPQDQHVTAEGVEDHSELTTFYIEAQQQDLGPWMQEDDRQKAFQAERDRITKGLRTSIVPIGIFLGLPVVLGIIIGQIALSGTIQQGDANAMAYVVGMMFAAGITLVVTLSLYRWIAHTFHNHTLKALPITLTVLGSVLFIISPLFNYTNTTIGGLVGYGVALGSLIGISLIITAITISIWTMPKISGLIKIIVLVACFGVSATVHYMAQ